MKILFTICGRAGSKGIKSKNIRDFCGKPLVYYSLSVLDLYLKKASLNSDDYNIVLSTDSPELIELVKKNPFRDVDIINRSEALSGDVVAKKDVILDCALQMEKSHNAIYDVIVDLDITSPLRTVEDLENLIAKYTETGADIVYSVTTARRSPYFNQVMKTEHGYKTVITSGFTARQQAPAVFDMNASLYAYSPRHLKAGGGFSEGYFEVIEMYDTGILDLDHENDFELMQVIAEYLFRNNSSFAAVYENMR